MKFLYAKIEGKLIAGVSFDELHEFTKQYTKNRTCEERMAVNEFVLALYDVAERDMLKHLLPKSIDN